MFRWRTADWRTDVPARLAWRTTPVWDVFVRLFHWGLVAAICVAGVTGFLLGAPWISVHVWGGTAAVALVAARIVWGFVGTTHARFGDFLVGPRSALRHLRDLRGGQARRHRGHNPLGGLMVVALLGVVTLIALTGVIALGGALKSGPAAFAVPFAVGDLARDVHNLLALTLLLLIALHVGGVVFESRRSRETLARAMIDGRKEVRPGDHRAPRTAARPVFAAVLVAAVLGGGAAVTARLSGLPALGAPVATLDAVYAGECGACHTAYHPSLLPRASWAAIMRGLDDHFGENAALDPATTARLAAWLDAGAAETADTRAANRLRAIDPARPLLITATPYWTRRHRDIPEPTFAAAAVGGKGQCAACHADAATGRFHPASIAIPTEIAK